VLFLTFRLWSQTQCQQGHQAWLQSFDVCSFDVVCYVVSNPRTNPLARPVGFAADSTNSEVYEDFAVIANTEGHVSSLT